ncbi:acyl-CoA dehydrogenase family protein [Robertmurraya massiliosenegalensis]|uniref:acyl-CoA dehydrogenase family protein n=1 Tax=Robertmurraya massiliosenegalensis TaxID=1287657 RepID=UPI0002EAB33D|nr:acyl-CoA dehydrogenase family protein [Robertmurraya massiliosenegalensis]
MEFVSKDNKVIQIINEKLLPFVRKIDEEAFYPVEFMKEIGLSGYFTSVTKKETPIRLKEITLIEETAEYCMTSAFLLWCHLATLASVRLSNNPYIKNELLPILERGEAFGGTGLSNALKYYAGLEPVRLKAERIAGGYKISGSLTNVSNLGNNHWIVILASVSHRQRVVSIIPVKLDGLVMERKTHFVGLNGSATYSCNFHNVFVPDKWIITKEADEFIKQVLPVLALYQIPLGLGVSKASIKTILNFHPNDVEVYKHLEPQPDELIKDIESIRDTTYKHAKVSDLSIILKDVLLTRLEIAKLTPRVVHVDMLYSGGKAYLNGNDSFRRLRKSYFLQNLSPTVKQLELLFY